MTDLDPHWEWAEIGIVGEVAVHYVKVRCLHLETVPVDLLSGEVIAQLCLTCDTPLPAAA